LPLILGATAASVTIGIGGKEPRQCDPATSLPIVVMAQDTAGNFIVGSFGVTVSLRDSDRSGDTSVAPGTVASSATPVTLAYNGYVLELAIISPSVPGFAKSALHSAKLLPQQMLWATDFNAGALEFPESADGNVAPVRHIPLSISTEDDALTPDCHLYVVNNGGSVVNIIDVQDGSSAELGGSNTHLSAPMAVGIDSTGKIYVSTQNDPSTHLPGIEIYAAGSTGNASPIEYLGGLKTEIQGPNALTFDSQNNLYIADTDSFTGQAAIEVFPAGVAGNVSPTQFLQNSAMTAFGIAVDSSDTIYVSNGSLLGGTGTIQVYPKGSTGNVSPSNTINVSYPGGAGGIAIDRAGNFHVNVFNAATVLSYPPNASGTTSPNAVLTGSNTGFSNAEDLAL
jgi:hypothetical protein